MNKQKKELADKVKRFRSIYNKETKGGTLDKPKPSSTVCCDRNADMMPCDCSKTPEKKWVCCEKNASGIPCDCTNPNVPFCPHCGSRHTGLCGPYDIG